MKSTSVNRFYEPKSYHPRESIAYLILRNKSIFQRLADIKLAKLGITASQMGVLMMIDYADSATVSLVTQLLGHTPAATVRMVQKLEDLGYVAKLPDGNDGRKSKLSLTKSGKKLKEAIPAHLCEFLNDSLAGFSNQEFKQFKDYLLRIEKNNLQQLESLS
jgi:DNA-binding MarR family transcriptional regulator